MIKKITCIKCPQGCELEVDIEGGHIIKVTGNQCQRGEAYGKEEIENPKRTLTSTVRAYGLGLKMVPVKTNKPIPKEKILTAMDEIKKIKLDRKVQSGDVIVQNFLGLEVDLLATRDTD